MEKVYECMRCTSRGWVMHICSFYSFSKVSSARQPAASTLVHQSGPFSPFYLVLNDIPGVQAKKEVHLCTPFYSYVHRLYTTISAYSVSMKTSLSALAIAALSSNSARTSIEFPSSSGSISFSMSKVPPKLW